MGSFIGHLVPGTFFFLFSLWWAWCVFHRYFLCKREALEGGDGGKGGFARKKCPVRYRSTSGFSSTCCSLNIPLEGILKVVAVAAGMTGEYLTAFDDGKFALGNGQHMTMFFFFGLNGIMDILLHLKIPLPPDIEYSSGILALFMEALLFYYHLHGRPPMDVLVHMLLFYVIVSAAISTTFEMKYRYNVLPALCRVYFMMLQGTWFYQIGFILYPPDGNKWDEHNHEQMMIVTLLFTWHNAAIFVFLLLLGIFIYFRVKSMDKAAGFQYLHQCRRRSYEFQTLLNNDEQLKNIITESEDEEV